MSKPQGENRTSQPQKKKRKARRWVWGVFYTLIALFLGGLVAGTTFIFIAYNNLPPVTDLKWDLTTVVYDRKGEEIAALNVGDEDRLYVPLSQIPQHVQDAVVAIEDFRFEDHFGVDLYRWPGALWATAKYFLGLPGGQVQGASTITQQLAKNAFLTQEQNIYRKVQDVLLAIKMERTWSKTEILEKYLNYIYFQSNVHGVQAASRYFFDKDVEELTLAEGSMLAGIIQNPARWSPYWYADDDENPVFPSQNSKHRQAQVLDAMAEHGYITPEVAAATKKAPVHTPGPPSRKADFVGAHFVDYVIEVMSNPALAEHYGLRTSWHDEDLYKAGLKVYTTMDLELQKIAEEKLRSVMDSADEQFGFTDPDPLSRPQAAVVTVTPQGEVVAMVGGRTHNQWREFNRAVSPRQPGSSIKPISVYLPGLEAGMSPGTVMDDAPYKLLGGKVWPENYDFTFAGLSTLRRGLNESVNTIAVRIVDDPRVGPKRSFESLQRLGITSLVDEAHQVNGAWDEQTAAMALGGLTNGISPLEMAQAFAVIANEGVRFDPRIILKITDSRDNVLWENTPVSTEVIKPGPAWLIRDMLKSVMEQGFGRQAKYGSIGGTGTLAHDAGGKTGTTEFNSDAWFVGFTNHYATAVWTGFDQGSEYRFLPESWTGAFQPSYLWNQVMVAYHEEIEVSRFSGPEGKGIVQASVGKRSGLPPGPYTPADEIIVEYFLAGTVPSQPDNVYLPGPFYVMKEHPDQLWLPGCGPDSVMRKFGLRRPQPYAEAGNRKPADWIYEIPSKTCRGGEVPKTWLPGMPYPDDGKGDQKPGNGKPGTDPSKPGNGGQPGTPGGPGNGGQPGTPGKPGNGGPGDGPGNGGQPPQDPGPEPPDDDDEGGLLPILPPFDD